MVAAEGLLAALEWNWTMVDSALDGLDDTLLARCPAAQCNSIAWTLWHMNRVVDTFIYTRLQAQEQLWLRDSWYEPFDMRENREDRGVGWTAEQVQTWVPPTRVVQVGYYEAVKHAARAYLASLGYADLETRRVIPPLSEPRTVAAALGQMAWDNIAHGGQIAYIRGLLTGMGWYTR